MFTIKHFVILLYILLNETNASSHIISKKSLFIVNRTSSFEQIFSINSSSSGIVTNNSITRVSRKEATDINQLEAVFDNNYSEQMSNESDVAIGAFHSGPHYEANWTFVDEETVRVVFTLYSLSKIPHQQQISHKNHHKKPLYSTMVAIPSRSLRSLRSLKYFLFTIRQYKTNTEKVLKMEPLILKMNPSTKDEYYSNSLLLIRLNPKEKYSICIYYYQRNISTRMPDLFICQDIRHDHLKHSVHGLLFVVTQYSIILGILIVLQGLFSMRKRRLAHIVRQHLINKTQRIRSTLSSVSLIRQSFSSIDATNEQQHHHHHHHHTTNDHKENKLNKRIISSPAIVISESSPLSNHPQQQQQQQQSQQHTNPADETEPFLKTASNKNHVHFFFSLDEGSDDNDSNDSHNEPYSDRSHALLSMAHILDTNKPWSKYNNHHTNPV